MMSIRPIPPTNPAVASRPVGVLVKRPILYTQNIISRPNPNHHNVKIERSPYLHSRTGFEVDKEVIPVRWSPPPPGWIKINTDGAVRRSTGASSCGGVFRDFRGSVVTRANILGPFSSFIGFNCSPLEAEMHGVIRAIDMAFEAGLKNVWLESDSTQLVHMLKSFDMYHVPTALQDDWSNTLDKIKSMNFRVSHVYREGNLVADKLANYAMVSKDSLTIWDSQQPDFIAKETALDASCHIYFRIR